MKVVYVISPDFLEAVFQESKKYSFELQGYGNFSAACKGLLYTNALDILGFAYMVEKFPAVGSKKLEEFIAFIKLCNLMGANKKFVIITKTFPKDIDVKLKEFTSLRFAVCVETDLITDITINQNLFGSILLDNYEPYELKEENTNNVKNYECTVLSCREVVSRYLFDVFEPIHTLDTEMDSISSDVIVMKYNEDLENPMVLLRIIAILIAMEHEYKTYKDRFLKKIEFFRDKRYGIYLAMLNMIERGPK